MAVPAIGRQANSLQRNAPGAVAIGPRREGASWNASPGAQRASELAEARTLMRERRAKVSALLEAWLANGERQLACGTLAERLRQFDVHISDDELEQRAAAYGVTKDDDGLLDVRELHGWTRRGGRARCTPPRSCARCCASMGCRSSG